MIQSGAECSPFIKKRLIYLKVFMARLLLHSDEAPKDF